MKQFIKSFLRSVGIEVRRPARGGNVLETVVRLEPPARLPVRGRALLSFVLEPFLRGDSAISNAHTHDWESVQMAQTLLDRGFAVDVISYLNRKFAPVEDYRLFISARTNFERIAVDLPAECVKVAHLDTAHWLFNNHAAYRRLLDLQQRRGITLNNIKMVEANWAIELADMGTVLGNDFTMDTYRFAGKPLFRIPISAPETYDWWASKDIDAARHRYLWFGSSGFVHKGLDLVLEAFAGMPDKQLVVCGPFDEESRFLEAFHKELFETPNIEAIGWVDVSGDRFREIAQSCIGLVYPTCSEGGGGSAITCMHAGMVPLLSREASVDVGDGGIIFETNGIAEIRDRVRALSDESEEKLAARVRASWSIARETHTRELFAEAFARFVDDHLLRLV